MCAAARMGAVGHLIGFAIGTVDLHSLWGGWLGATQFKQLCVISAAVLLGTCGLTSWAVTERVLLSARYEGDLLDFFEDKLRKDSANNFIDPAVGARDMVLYT